MHDKNPCYGCVPPKRTSDCHTYCDQWIPWKDEHEKDREEKNKEKYLETQIIAYQVAVNQRVKKDKTKHKWRSK